MRYEDLTGERLARVQAQRARSLDKQSKRDAIQRVNDHLVSLIGANFPVIAMGDAGFDIMRSIRAAIAPAARSPALQLAVDQFVYARDRKEILRNGTPADALAYDPVADPGWPE